MIVRTQILDPRLLQRRCVSCGYDGALLRGGLAPRCARCGCDLRKRPARSYVEMEGLATGADGHRPMHALEQARLTQRWGAFLLMAALGLGIIVYLTAAAFSV